jgi:hypothetical protein
MKFEKQQNLGKEPAFDYKGPVVYKGIAHQKNSHNQRHQHASAHPR